MDNKTIDNMTIGIQNFLRRWQGMLHTIGDALVPSKRGFVAIDFKWKNGRWYYVENDTRLYMEYHNQQEEILTQLQHHEVKKMLGIYVTADGNNKMQVEILRGKVTGIC